MHSKLLQQPSLVPLELCSQALETSKSSPQSQSLHMGTRDWQSHSPESLGWASLPHGNAVLGGKRY